MEVDLVKEVLCGLLGRRRFDRICPRVAQDGRVDSICETDITKVRVRANPIIVNRLVRSQLAKIV